MKLIKPSFLIKEQEPELLGIYRQIEYAGRICYKSSDKITENSAKPFVDRMVKSGHGAMLEHGTVYLKRKSSKEDNLEWAERYLLNPYSRISYGEDSPRIDDVVYNTVYITSNYRVLVEQGWLDDLKYLCEPTEFHEKRITIKFTLSRSIAQEFTRHRVFSFAMESQRYCNYSRDKFNHEVTFVQPSWLTDNDISHWKTIMNDSKWFLPDNDDVKSDINTFMLALEMSESEYLSLVYEEGWKPQQAREVLSNACKAELIMTGFVNDWWGEYLVIDKTTDLIDQRIHGKFWNELDSIDREKYLVIEKGFFPLRCSKAAHPQAQELALPLREEFIKRKLW